MNKKNQTSIYRAKERTSSLAAHSIYIIQHKFIIVISLLCITSYALCGCSNASISENGTVGESNSAAGASAAASASSSEAVPAQSSQPLNVSIDQSSAAYKEAVAASRAPFDGTEHLQESTLSGHSRVTYDNTNATLSVPTDITKIDGKYFIVDCYHSQIIYNDSLDAPLTDWHVLTDNASSGYSLGHTIVSDGTVLLADDTDNNRVLVFEKEGDGYALTQTFDNIGNKPHYIVYDKETSTFYCWSSYSGEMYLFRHSESDSRMYLTKIEQIDRLTDTYVRSFTIEDGHIYFVSGLPANGTSTYLPEILEYDLYTFQQTNCWAVPDAIAGMVQLAHIGNYYYVTVSTDLSGSQDAATILRAPSLDAIAQGDYEDIYSTYFVGGGTPYYMGEIDGTWYLTEHRLINHSIWSFTIDDQGAILSSNSIY